MGKVFLGFGGWVRRFGCAFFGLRVEEGHDFYFFWGGGGGGVLGVLIGGSELEWEMPRTGWGDRRGALCTGFTLVSFVIIKCVSCLMEIRIQNP